MDEAKTHEPVIENSENGAEIKETTKDPKGDVVIDDKADANKLEEMQVGKDSANGGDIVDEKLNEVKKVEQNEDLKEERFEKDEVVEKNDNVAEEGVNSDSAKESDKGTETETVEKEVENKIELEKPDVVEGKEFESEKPNDVEGKQDESEKPGDPEGKQDESEKPDAVVDSKGNSAEGQESEKDVVEEKEMKKSGKGKNDTKKANEKFKDVQEPKTPAAASFSIDRPVRERKSVERLVAIIERDSFKEFHIEKGNGTALKDIPNVAYKLSRRKSDDTLKLLHGVLFSRRGKAADIKQHIYKFSGFVWHGDEEKQKLKIKEKLEKYNKEKLFDFCDILDITIASKTTIRKDEVVAMLLEFLIAPHATTDKLLAEKEESSKGSKRKRTEKGTPGSGSAKSQTKWAETSKTDQKTNSFETEDQSAEDTKEREDGVSDEAVRIPETKESTEELANKSLSEEKLSEPETQIDEGAKNKKRKSTLKKQVDSDVKTPRGTLNPKKVTSGSAAETSKAKRKRTPSLKSTPSTKETHSFKKPKIDAEKVTSPKTSSKKQKDEKPVKEKHVVGSKEKSGKGAVSKRKEKSGVDLSDERLREEACKILKEVDFNTATFTDIVKILAERFKTDLTPRKSVIKMMIQEELTKLANEEEDDEEEDDGKASSEDDSPKDETPSSTSQKV